MTDLTRTGDESAAAFPTPELVNDLAAIIGEDLTAYVAGANDTRTIDRWIRDGIQGLDKQTADRLRLLYATVIMLSEHHSPEVIQGWLVGMNPIPGYRSVLQILRNERLDIAAALILPASIAFAAQG